MRSTAFARMLPIFGVLASPMAPASAQTVEGVVPAGSRSAVPGPASNFTGSVSVRPVVDAKEMGRTTLGEVTFQPAARSNWHTHPGGQSLYVTKGCGWTQREGGPIVLICEGDTAFVPSGVRHWHGETSASPMTHLSITENVGGNNVNWMEPVTDAEYGEGAKQAR